jgi:hypothetical protein
LLRQANWSKTVELSQYSVKFREAEAKAEMITRHATMADKLVAEQQTMIKQLTAVLDRITTPNEATKAA